jgi:NAD+ synthase
MIKEMLEIKNPANTVEQIELFIRENVKYFYKDGAVLGISGGIDSALTAFLTVHALGKDRVFALFLPDRDSDPQSKKDAQLVADTLGIKLKTIDITKILSAIGVYKLAPKAAAFVPRKAKEQYVRSHYSAFSDKNETAFIKDLKGGEGNKELMRGIAYHRVKHRVRMVMWYFYGEQKNYLVVGCCNKTEKLTGYFVKYGDGGSDIDPIANLYKTQVKQLARFVGVPEQIIQKAPSPDLVPGITDEFALGISYNKLDIILYGLEKGLSEQDILNEGISEKEIEYVKEMMKLSAHMREMPKTPFGK